MRFGIVSLVTGLALYIVAAVERVGEYRNQPQPGWLTTLWLIATALVVVGLLVMANIAVRVYRERVQQ
jgi:heme/copper-type cytochrome/quinol oxidase subunit 2